ncbi:hypothetical protein ACX0G9_10195 [Flavitalea flava]
MIFKSILTLISFYCFFGTGKVRKGQNALENCSETETLINKIAVAKVNYEESVYRKEKKQGYYREYYSTLVKEFKRKRKRNARESCLRQLISRDSISRRANSVNFTFKPLTSSIMEKCDDLSYSSFLKIMLANLNDSSSNNTIVCYPELARL